MKRISHQTHKCCPRSSPAWRPSCPQPGPPTSSGPRSSRPPSAPLPPLSPVSPSSCGPSLPGASPPPPGVSFPPPPEPLPRAPHLSSSVRPPPSAGSAGHMRLLQAYCRWPRVSCPHPGRCWSSAQAQRLASAPASGTLPPPSASSGTVARTFRQPPPWTQGPFRRRCRPSPPSCGRSPLCRLQGPSLRSRQSPTRRRPPPPRRPRPPPPRRRQRPSSSSTGACLREPRRCPLTRRGRLSALRRRRGRPEASGSSPPRRVKRGSAPAPRASACCGVSG
mmetsp:Transcript_21491/g.64514  ORF Transcript_21491/g.64514 Transcript_21491/m.64514 type:complete len:278 (-) Transcript_21491:186-1019(-)